jgi:murein DD-endopeptidase MepM/ murein hydrolase activator NlpD
VASGALILKLGDLAKASELQQENSLLVADVARMQETVDQLTQSMTTISERDRRFRLLAGLPELDPEVRQVGIGGPGTGSIESEPLLELDPALGGEVFAATGDLNRLLRQSNLLQASLVEASRAMETRRDELVTYPSIDPTNGWLSSSFSRSRWHPLLNIRRPHEGIDISAPRGTPVVATADGQVTYAGWRPGFGWTVEVDHGNGLKTRYAHNEKNLKVKVGDSVRRGDTVALVGSSGLAKGPHVHYEVLQNGRAVNPDNYRLSKVIVD